MYHDLSFEEELLFAEEQIRRRHRQRMLLRRNTQLLQQELELEDELLESNPELAQIVHDINLLETQAHHQGFGSIFDGDTNAKKSNVWNKFFPGLG